MRMTKVKVICGCLVAVVVCGCQTQAQKKAAFIKNYEQKASPVKLTAVQTMFEQGQVESALQAVDEVLRVESENAAAYTLQGRILLSEQEYGKAHESFDKAVTLNEKDAEAWFGLGVIAQSGDDHSAALDYYQKSLYLEPTRTEIILAVANTLEILDRRSEAAQFLDIEIAGNSSDIKLLCAAADMANRTRQTDKAITLYRRAATLNPKDEQVLHSLAMTYVFRGQWSDAADTFERLLACTEDEKKQADYLYWVADSSLNAGRFSRALKCFDTLSISRRKDADIWLGMAQSALGISDARRARNCARKAMSYRTDCYDAQIILGCADYMDGKYLTAINSFLPLVNNESLGGFASFMAGRCYQKLGRDAQAQRAFENAVQLDPQSPLVAMFLNNSRTR